MLVRFFTRRGWLFEREREREVWQIKAQCVDENGKLVGALFPNNINELSSKRSKKCFSMAKGEQLGCRVTRILKENLFPEPEGVTFVRENNVWVPLELKYRSLGINEALRIYHKDGDDHLSINLKKKTKQDFRNRLWNFGYELNNSNLFRLSLKRRIKLICGYLVLEQILVKMGDVEFVKKYSLKGKLNCVFRNIFWLPSIVIANWYYGKVL